MIKFESQHDQTSPKVTIEMMETSFLGEVIETFETFLRATGYVFEGHLAIEESSGTKIVFRKEGENE